MKKVIYIAILLLCQSCVKDVCIPCIDENGADTGAEKCFVSETAKRNFQKRMVNQGVPMHEYCNH